MFEETFFTYSEKRKRLWMYCVSYTPIHDVISAAYILIIGIKYMVPHKHKIIFKAVILFQ